MVFIDLKKAYYRVHRDVLWYALNKKAIPLKYVSIIRDMYERVVTNVKSYGGLTNVFLITIKVHQRSTFNHFLFVIVIDEITKGTKDEIP